MLGNMTRADLCRDIPGGFSTRACAAWISLLHANTRYFEWGSGFTTRASDTIAGSVVSIEGSRPWHQKMSEGHAFSPRTRLRFVDIGPTKAFSWPVNHSLGETYIHAIDDYGPQDVVLVDGRFRVACALAAFRHIAAGGRLLVHDFGRAAYHVLLEWYTTESEVDSLAILVPKANATAQRLRARLRAASRDPR